MSKKFSIASYNEHDSEGTFRPQLTSLVDVMTILLVFLLKSFSVEGNLVTPSSDLVLPYSNSQKTPRPVYSIEITQKEVIADGKIIAPIDDFKNQDSLTIPSLYEWMRLEKTKSFDTAGVKEVMIQSDRNIAFNVVKRVMYTCSKAGFTDFSVLVLQEE